MTNSPMIDKRAMAIVLALCGYDQREAISVLAAAISMITSQAEQAGDRLGETCMAFNSNLLRRHQGRLSRIEYDPEIESFINNLDRYYTGKDLLAMIEKRFGKKRTPSKSSLGRYLQKIAGVIAPAKEENK